MRAALAPGDPVTVIWRTVTPPGAMKGSLRSASVDAVAVDLAGEPCWQTGDEVLLVIGEAADRHVAAGTFVTALERAAVFRLKRAFRPCDLRRETRYPLRVRAQVRSTLGQSRQDGLVLDFSMGGMAVEVKTKPGGRQVEVPLQVAGFSATLPCQIVGVSGGEDRVVLHLKFAALTPPQQAFVRNVVAALDAGFDQLAAAS